MTNPTDAPGQPLAGERPYNFRSRKRAAPDPPSRSASADASDRSDSPAGTMNMPLSDQEVARRLDGYLSRGSANPPNEVPPAPTRGDTDNSTTAHIAQFTTAVMHLIRAPLNELEQTEPAWGSAFRNFFGQLAGRAMAGLQPPPDITAIFTIPPTPTASPPPRPSASSASTQESWASKAQRAAHLPQQTRPPPLPPKLQSKEDRRVMIRIDKGHPTRQEDPYIIRQKIGQILKNDKVAKDVWAVPSGFTVLANTPAQAATIIAHGTEIENAIGSAKVERQEKWTTFVVGPILKRIQTVDGIVDPVAEGLVLTELQLVLDNMPIRRLEWTRRAQDALEEGFVRICVPSSKAALFPPNLRIFSRPVRVQRVRDHNPTSQCGRCFGFHPDRLCARDPRCAHCGKQDRHIDCPSLAKCINCCGPHDATDTACPARPQHRNGQLIRPTKNELRAIRNAGGQASTKRDTQAQREKEASMQLHQESEAMQSSSTQPTVPQQ
jgi:hypothetical protein